MISSLDDITLKEATAYLAGKKRGPTFYTYMHKKAHQKITSTPQGPHTVSNRFISYQTRAVTQENIGGWFRRHVPSPGRLRRLLRKELGTVLFSDSVNRFIDDYQSLYDLAETAVDEIETADDNDEVVPTGKMTRARALLYRLLNMHPYQTYSWKSGKQAGRKSLKGKGEAKHIRSVYSLVQKERISGAVGLIDKPRKMFTYKSKFRKFVSTRMSMHLDSTDVDQVIKDLDL